MSGEEKILFQYFYFFYENNFLKKKNTIVIVPHNIQQASRIADRVAFLAGELVEEGFVAQIFTKPQKKLTEDYLSGKYG